VATSNSCCYSPKHQVFIVVTFGGGDDPGTSHDREDQFLDDISNNELSADAPADEITEVKNTRCAYWRLLSTYFKAANSWILPQELSIHSRIGAYTYEFH
jgi:hypothetical protein